MLCAMSPIERKNDYAMRSRSAGSAGLRGRLGNACEEEGTHLRTTRQNTLNCPRASRVVLRNRTCPRKESRVTCVFAPPPPFSRPIATPNMVIEDGRGAGRRVGHRGVPEPYPSESGESPGSRLARGPNAVRFGAFPEMRK